MRSGYRSRRRGFGFTHKSSPSVIAHSFNSPAEIGFTIFFSFSFGLFGIKFKDVQHGLRILGGIFSCNGGSFQ
jgi:hypothetical protein